MSRDACYSKMAVMIENDLSSSDDPELADHSVLFVVPLTSSTTVIYTDFFAFSDVVTRKEDCSAKCKLRFKNYKYTLTTKGSTCRINMNKH